MTAARPSHSTGQTSALPPHDCWLLHRYGSGAPLGITDLVSPLGRTLLQATFDYIAANGTEPWPALQKVLLSQPEGIRQAILAIDPDKEPRGEAGGEGGAPRCIVHWGDEALLPQDDIDWIVDRLLTAGSVCLVVGEPGSKKTWAMLDLAVCIVKGEPWVGYETKRGRVLIIDEESGPRRLKRRLSEVLRGHAVQAEDARRIAWVSLAGFNLREASDLGTLAELIDQEKPLVVIVDALADIMPGADENAVKDTQPVFHALRQIAESRQVAIVVIHHTNKAGGYRGSTAIKGAVDLMLMVESKEGSGDIDFATEKPRDTEPFSFSAAIRFDEATTTTRLDATGIRPKTVKLTKTEELIVHYLRDHAGQALLKDIVTDNEELSSPATLRGAAAELKNRGIITRADPGGHGSAATYKLTAEGN